MVIVDLSLLLTLPVTSFGIRQSEWHANARAGRPSDSAILPDGAYGAALLFNGLDNHVGLIPPGEKLSKQRTEERHADQNHDKAFNRNVRDSGYPPALHATLAGRRPDLSATFWTHPGVQRQYSGEGQARVPRQKIRPPAKAGTTLTHGCSICCNGSPPPTMWGEYGHSGPWRDNPLQSTANNTAKL